MLLERFYRNHVLANLLFVLVLVVGTLSYVFMPREQDPTINFNWVVITTVLPGAAAGDIEKRVTDPLEDAIRNIADIQAYRYGEASFLAPLAYTRIILIAAAGYLLFDEIPDAWTIAGGAVIVASALYIAQRERALARAQNR